jgi:copper chaperone
MAQTITVTGMSCDGCERSVEEALNSVDGVTSVSVDRTTDSATIEGETDTETVIAAVEDAGYEGSG